MWTNILYILALVNVLYIIYIKVLLKYLQIRNIKVYVLFSLLYNLFNNLTV